MMSHVDKTMLNMLCELLKAAKLQQQQVSE